MSDSRQVHRAIKKAILQLYPNKPQGNLARHLATLVCLVSGIVLSKSCQLPKMASKVPSDVHPDSRTKQFSRWVNNDAIAFDRHHRLLRPHPCHRRLPRIAQANGGCQGHFHARFTACWPLARGPR